MRFNDIVRIVAMSIINARVEVWVGITAMIKAKERG